LLAPIFPIVGAGSIRQNNKLSPPIQVRFVFLVHAFGDRQGPAPVSAIPLDTFWYHPEHP
jgi:hypothetical protein